MIDKLLGAVLSKRSDPVEALDADVLALIEQLKARRYIYTYETVSFKEYDAYQTLKNRKPRAKAQCLLLLSTVIVQKAVNKRKEGHSTTEPDDPMWTPMACYHVFNALMRTKADFTPAEVLELFDRMMTFQQSPDRAVYFLPFGFMTKQLEAAIKAHGLSDDDKPRLERLSQDALFTTENRSYYGSDNAKIGIKLKAMVHVAEHGAEKIEPFARFSNTAFGQQLRDDLAAATSDEAAHWHALLHKAAALSGAKPPKAYRDHVAACTKAVGATRYKATLHRWLESALSMDVNETEHTFTHGGHSHVYTERALYLDADKALLKGLVFSLLAFHDSRTLDLVARLGARCFEKIPGVGPAAAGVGNACLHVLANTKGLEGVSHLSRLKLRIKQSNTQKLIETLLTKRAEKLGLKPAQIEEMAAPDFDLVDGARTVAFDDYALTLRMTGVGKTALTWTKPDGSPQKSVPAFVKSDKRHSERLKALRVTAKSAQQASTAQRDRIDRLFVEDMSWPYEDFARYYLDHGLVSMIARAMIWWLQTGDARQAGLFVDGAWQDVHGRALAIDETTVVRLWHPIEAETDDVLAWRDRLDQLEITQPLKQAYREIYVVTDAEVNTRVYSNRMASHLLKQHQFNVLTALRGWKYTLMGAYDDGRESETASKILTAYGIQAEYWVDEVADDDAFNEAGIWLYVATDQVRFRKVDQPDAAMDIIDVPAIVFSEIMRDVDLFVGVASVGNDPQWRDGGAARETQREYWHTYAFGELGEVAKTRQAVLERLLPRLKIRDKAWIDGRFLHVKGTRHTYKIHIGSTNIMIAPMDRYLCIVPGRSKDTNLETIRLPFEGDRGLSIVLSKAFMLAADDKITDETILSQL
ncbi:MAG: DUF4132 domain-containing protein [Pseudomonadota bacterium]